MSELDVSPTSSRRWIGTRTTSLTDRREPPRLRL
jgi:hypothetical protein